MKRLPLYLSSLSILAFQPLSAQAPAKTAAAGIERKNSKNADTGPKVNLDDTEKKADVPDVPAAPVAPAEGSSKPLPGLEKLSPEKIKALVAGMGEVSNYLRGVRWLEALAKLVDLEATCGESHYISNLRGAVYTRMRDFVKARSHFTKALELSKGMDFEMFHPKFNLAELDFVEKKFDDARVNFTKLLTDPGKPAKDSDTLIKFKVMICDVMQKKLDSIDKQIASFDQFDENSPAYYYAQATKLFGKDDKEGASEWLDSARKIYPKELNEVYDDSLVEMGWLETLK